MFAAKGKVTEVLVNVFIPLMEKLPVMVAAEAVPHSAMETAVAAAITRFFVILNYLSQLGMSSNSYFLDNLEFG